MKIKFEIEKISIIESPRAIKNYYNLSCVRRSDQQWCNKLRSTYRLIKAEFYNWFLLDLSKLFSLIMFFRNDFSFVSFFIPVWLNDKQRTRHRSIDEQPVQWLLTHAHSAGSYVWNELFRLRSSIVSLLLSIVLKVSIWTSKTGSTVFVFFVFIRSFVRSLIWWCFALLQNSKSTDDVSIRRLQL